MDTAMINNWKVIRRRSEYDAEHLKAQLARIPDHHTRLAIGQVACFLERVVDCLDAALVEVEDG